MKWKDQRSIICNPRIHLKDLFKNTPRLTSTQNWLWIESTITRVNLLKAVFDRGVLKYTSNFLPLNIPKKTYLCSSNWKTDLKDNPITEIVIYITIAKIHGILLHSMTIMLDT
ncbi:uncharacterized protein EV154DRAFT_485929 [Mucor mucedo]|uniref:uncharacterized protein n=1 Tax=Mucor mucedo TaxID=29922 RepID=UPI00221E53ED|nr:uncharacterized protein EV154DRAFT_485929 [Mucor mucedo]KAI7880254.1 hypothetical protein EV154DRAFT_485929 [Mucor mucedo]